MKRLFIVILVAIFSMCAYTANAEISGLDTKFDIKAGYFLPSEDAIDSIYGNSPVLGIDFIAWSKKAGLSLGLNYIWNSDGEPKIYGSVSSASSELTITTIHVTGLYRIYEPDEGKGFCPYFGLGLIGCRFEEELEVNSDSASASENAFGLHALAGIEIPLQSTSSSLFFEADISNATLDVESADDDLNIGGITLYAGIRF